MVKTTRTALVGRTRCVGEGETITEAARKMRADGVDCLPIRGADNRLKIQNSTKAAHKTAQ